MKDKIEIAKKTIEQTMENLAITLDKINKIEKQLEKMGPKEDGYWEEVNEHTSDKRCSNCGRVGTPTLFCQGCGSKNIHGVDKPNNV